MTRIELEAWAKSIDAEYETRVKRAAERRILGKMGKHSYDEQYANGYLTALARMAAEVRIRAGKEDQ